MWLLKSMISLLLTTLYHISSRPFITWMQFISGDCKSLILPSINKTERPKKEVKLESRMIGGNYLANYELGALTIQTWLLSEDPLTW